MTTKVLILGASGGCLDTIELINEINEIEKNKFEIIGILEDNEELKNKKFFGFSIIGNLIDVNNIDQNLKIVNSLGSEKNFYKKEKLILNDLKINKRRLQTLIHPLSNISQTAKIGDGSIVYQNVSIGRNVNLGHNVIILPNSFIGHDTTIGDFSILNAGVMISGYVKISSLCYIGTNVSVKNFIEIKHKSLIGMGSNVLRSTETNSINYGNPCDFIKNLDS